MPQHVYDRADSDRTYHGLQQGADDGSADEEEWEPARLLVEQTRFGPTERESAAVLRKLEEPEHSGFGWGYNGGGTSATAAAILADALDLDPDEFDLIEADDETLESLREDFCTDVLAVCADEFRLRRGAVLFPVKSAC